MVIKMDIRKVERRFIDVRNPDHTIKKVVGEYQNETPEEVEARLLEEAGNTKPRFTADRERGDCLICHGSGEIPREQAVNVRFEGDGRMLPESCYACGGSGKYEDYLKWKDTQPPPKSEREPPWKDFRRESNEPYPDDDWIET